MTQRILHPQKKPTAILTAEEIELLQKYRQIEHVSFAEMNTRMESPFGWTVLQRAMQGRPVWVLNHAHIAGWIERNLSGLKTSL
jgi:hypothetical protein